VYKTVVHKDCLSLYNSFTYLSMQSRFLALVRVYLNILLPHKINISLFCSLERQVSLIGLDTEWNLQFVENIGVLNIKHFNNFDSPYCVKILMTP